MNREWRPPAIARRAIRDSSHFRQSHGMAMIRITRLRKCTSRKGARWGLPELGASRRAENGIRRKSHCCNGPIRVAVFSKKEARTTTIASHWAVRDFTLRFTSDQYIFEAVPKTKRNCQANGW